MKQLDKYRRKIDTIDRKMAALFTERMQIVAKISDYKEENGFEITDSEREKQVLENNTALVPEELRECYEDFQKKVMEVSRKYQKVRRKENDG